MLSVRVRAVDLPIPKELDRDLYLWRCMIVRFRIGDYRYKEDELKALKKIAQWTFDVNCALRNQPTQKLEL